VVYRKQRQSHRADPPPASSPSSAPALPRAPAFNTSPPV
jgi:hypothetical protein